MPQFCHARLAALATAPGIKKNTGLGDKRLQLEVATSGLLSLLPRVASLMSQLPNFPVATTPHIAVLSPGPRTSAVPSRSSSSWRMSALSVGRQQLLGSALGKASSIAGFAGISFGCPFLGRALAAQAQKSARAADRLKCNGYVYHRCWQCRSPRGMPAKRKQRNPEASKALRASSSFNKLQ